MVWMLLLLALPGVALAGASDGARAVVERVDPSAADVYLVEFQGEALASVALRGDGDTDLDLRVLDASGNVIASDTGDGDHSRLSWIPARTGLFQLEVRNNGDVFNEYVLTTN